MAITWTALGMTTEQRMKKLASLMTAVLTLALISGCTVGPNYHKPVVQLHGVPRTERKSAGPSAGGILRGPSLVAKSSRTRNCKSSSVQR